MIMNIHKCGGKRENVWENVAAQFIAPELIPHCRG